MCESVVRLRRVVLLLGLCLVGGLAHASTQVTAKGGDGEEARQARRLALWHYMNGLYAQDIGDTGRALAEYQQATLYDPASSAIHSQLAYHYYVSGLDYKTVEELQKSLKLSPQDTDTPLALGRPLRQAGPIGPGPGAIPRGAPADPKNSDARYYLAGVYVADNHNDDAILQYKTILKQDPKESWAYYAWYNLGLIYTRVNDHKKAEDAYRSAIELNPEMESAYLSLGLLLEWDKRRTDAVRVYRDLLKRDSENAAGWMALGKLYYDSRDYTTALQVFREYRKGHPRDLNGLEYLGLSAYRLDEFKEAAEVFALLVKAQPNSNVNRYRLASAYEGLGRWKDAEEQLNFVAAQDPREVDAWVRLALLSQRQNKPEETRAILDQPKP
jgi:tetratricopeptide (TPR) repeat protein